MKRVLFFNEHFYTSMKRHYTLIPSARGRIFGLMGLVSINSFSPDLSLFLTQSHLISSHLLTRSSRRRSIRRIPFHFVREAHLLKSHLLIASHLISPSNYIFSNLISSHLISYSHRIESMKIHLPNAFPLCT